MKRYAGMVGLMLSACVALAGCGGEEAEVQEKVPVKAMKVLQQDTPLSYSYAGRVASKDEVKIHPKVSGMILEKYVKGGDQVQAGQPLYKIESRQYESELTSAEANLHRSQANLRKAREDLVRYEQLLSADAISEQTVANQRADVDSYQADVESYAALAQKARENLEDTMVYAPMDGRVALDDVAVGTYATAGNTTLVSVGSMDPVYVQFSVSETEYLEIVSEAMGSETNVMDGSGDNFVEPRVAIRLSNGKEYPYYGKLVEADSSLGEGTGTLLIKALFPNPSGLLLSGMFAHVVLLGDVHPNAILVPQRAVQQLLDQSFVLTVGADGKSVSKKVKLGEKVGSYYIIEDGVTADDVVIVEGLSNLQSGQEVEASMVTPEEMGFTMEDSKTIVNKS